MQNCNPLHQQAIKGGINNVLALENLAFFEIFDVMSSLYDSSKVSLRVLLVLELSLDLHN